MNQRIVNARIVNEGTITEGDLVVEGEASRASTFGRQTTLQSLTPKAPI